ncbi:CocE/NonD family hydrolase [Aeromicrobium endophyticum]|uniref:CocE/NonD family hydrolase n=2 Tax=Aeromicrobium endophyticum TaxID=2292704 RepID=A0A371NZS5_9ACTN|nr:CocE/NonD family hydrolase [Aeromicrobium endophyticum]
MQIEYDVPIPMSDGTILRANVFRPIGDGEFPVLMSYGPYGKDLPFQDAYPRQFDAMVKAHPEIAVGTTGKHQVWELADPERWVPLGYALVRVDARGSGRSPGFIDSFASQETRDFYECIEWGGTQPWSNGKVGLSGISYYAINQWAVAALQPPHLAAICPWEGMVDWYRDANYHGGIPSSFFPRLYGVQIETVQHGLGTRGQKNERLGVLVSGDVDLGEDELGARRADVAQELRQHPFIDSYWRDRSADLSKVHVPVLSAGNWGGQALHLRGNIAGFVESASEQKWLEVHGEAHWTLYYSDYGVDLQRRFFDYFLKDEGDWSHEQPPVSLNIRHPDETFELRAEQEWPIARTDWTTYYLDAADNALSLDPRPQPSEITYEPFGPGVTLLTPAFEEATEITGPVAAKLFVSSESEDTDLFLVLHLIDPDGAEVLFEGATEPRHPLSQGWLRASHRALDSARSLPYQPVHPHDAAVPLVPGETYELDVEIWPTCIVVPPGCRIALSVLGRDFDHGREGLPTAYGVEMRGSGVNVHDDPVARSADVYNRPVTLRSGGAHPSYLLLPVVPPA